MKKVKLYTTIITLTLTLIPAFAFVTEDVRPDTLHPDYSYEYVGNDKYETFNRKMFNLNMGFNKYAVRPVHTLWASIMPQYGIDRIKCACNNIEAPIRITSCLIQRDFKNSGKEVLRFLTNSTIGLGGLFDPATSLFKLEQSNEDMDQALASCKIKSGPYLVLPGLSSTTPRGIVGKILDAGLNPSSYIATPVIAMVKAGLLINKTSDIHSMAKTVQEGYADPYEIAKKFYGAKRHIQHSNLDHSKVLEEKCLDCENSENIELVKNPIDNEFNATIQKEELNNNEALTIREIANAGENIENVILKSYDKADSKVMADLVLFDYNPQTPLIDAMRTALFDMPGIKESIWHELSIWNNCFCNRIKTAKVNIYPNREDYKFRYLLQKDKNAPLAIIYPSIGEGSMSHHSTVFAKIFYDEGYSVLIQGNHFQWEFAKSMPEDYTPGIPTRDVEQIKLVTNKEIEYLEQKYNRKFTKKTVIGTSFGAIGAIYLAASEHKENTLGDTNYIAISPPVDLVYALEQADKNCISCNYNSSDLKDRVTLIAAKVLNILNSKDKISEVQDKLPFSNDEAKLITAFIMHQKLSDLVFTLEDTPTNKKTDIYNILHNLTYKDYVEKYILPKTDYTSLAELKNELSLLSLGEYLTTQNNYKIYQSLDDYFVNSAQLKKLKQMTLKNTVLISNGSHLGFLYRKEFLDELKKDIQLNKE